MCAGDGVRCPQTQQEPQDITNRRHQYCVAPLVGGERERDRNLGETSVFSDSDSDSDGLVLFVSEARKTNFQMAII